MNSFSTINPKNGSPLATYDHISTAAARKALALSQEVYRSWRREPLAKRQARLARFGERLLAEAPRLGRMATDEMGKPLNQAIKEVEKCAAACRFYVKEAERMLANEPIATEADESFIAYQPLGPVLSIMPWNFPFWQVIRFAAPALTAGNTILMKHADNTTGCALEINRLFEEAGYPHGAFQALLLDHRAVHDIIKDDIVQAVTLTGSERAGRTVAATAAGALKKTVLELGGSDAYVILSDADIEAAARICVEARLVNSGQSCVAAKRFIVVEKVYKEFAKTFTDLAQQKIMGDPLEPTTHVGPLAKESIWQEVSSQIRASIAAGAKALLGGNPLSGPGYFVPVTVLDDVRPGMPAFDDEVFGPVAALIRAKSEDDAMELANQHRYGLGGAIFSQNIDRARRLATEHLEAGFCVVNGQVTSDPRLPFGGIKASGYGRELSQVGMREFVNIKSVVVHHNRS